MDSENDSPFNLYIISGEQERLFFELQEVARLGVGDRGIRESAAKVVERSPRPLFVPVTAVPKGLES